MPNEPTKPKQPNWIDVLPPGAPRPDLDGLLTRQELIEDLHDRGVEVDEIALVYWERRGILPRAIRTRRGGRPYALYPHYAFEAVKHLRQLQAAGKSLEEIAPFMKMWALAPVQWEDPYTQPTSDVREPLLAFARALRPEAAGIRVELLDEEGRTIHTHELSVPTGASDSKPG